MPRAKPNETMVSTGWSTVAAVAAPQLLAQLGRGEVGGVEHAVGDLAQRRGRCRVRGRSRPRPGGRARAGGGGGSRRSGGSARPRRSRGRGFPGVTPSIERIRSGSVVGIEAAAAHVHPDRDRDRAAAPARSPWTKSSSSAVGRLSTQSQPMSSSASSTVDLPAPDMPVTSSRRGSRLVARRPPSELRARAGRAPAPPWTAPKRSSRRR